MAAQAAFTSAIAAPAFRRALSRFATGVTLITAPGGDALVVNAFMSVSLDPPLVAFCVGGASLTWRRMRRSARLGINVLGDTVDDVRGRARPGADRLTGLEAHVGRDGVPRLVDAVAFLSCEAIEERPAGDHVLVLCSVLEATCHDERVPLVFFDGTFGSFAA
jgi:3-hydroxy-9,10-secoandrosta-1,3,5(10)-triene-9,17-dione monooxygenase reductase component